jgi:predicted dinucleotide-binding enzyme
VIDIGNYHPELRDGRIDAIDCGMLDSQWVAQQIGRPVIKAFNNVLAKSLLEKGVPKVTKGRIALPVAGDPPDPGQQCFASSTILASTLSTVVTAGTLKPLLPDARSRKLIGTG